MRVKNHGCLDSWLSSLSGDLQRRLSGDASGPRPATPTSAGPYRYRANPLKLPRTHRSGSSPVRFMWQGFAQHITSHHSSLVPSSLFLIIPSLYPASSIAHTCSTLACSAPALPSLAARAAATPWQSRHTPSSSECPSHAATLLTPHLCVLLPIIHEVAWMTWLTLSAGELGFGQGRRAMEDSVQRSPDGNQL